MDQVEGAAFKWWELFCGRFEQGGELLFHQSSGDNLIADPFGMVVDSVCDFIGSWVPEPHLAGCVVAGVVEIGVGADGFPEFDFVFVRSFGGIGVTLVIVTLRSL